MSDVAASKRVSESILEEEQKSRLASQPFISERVQMMLAKDWSEVVRECLASNPIISKEVQLELAKHGNEKVVSNLVSNPATKSEEVLLEITRCVAANVRAKNLVRNNEVHKTANAPTLRKEPTAAGSNESAKELRDLQADLKNEAERIVGASKAVQGELNAHPSKTSKAKWNELEQAWNAIAPYQDLLDRVQKRLEAAAQLQDLKADVEKEFYRVLEAGRAMKEGTPEYAELEKIWNNVRSYKDKLAGLLEHLEAAKSPEEASEVLMEMKDEVAEAKKTRDGLKHLPNKVNGAVKHLDKVKDECLKTGEELLKNAKGRKDPKKTPEYVQAEKRLNLVYNEQDEAKRLDLQNRLKEAQKYPDSEMASRVLKEAQKWLEEYQKKQKELQ